jgi:alpha-galactosidase
MIYHSVLKRIKGISIFICILIFSINSFANPSFKVNPDGSFDIMGTSVSLKNCYPAIDGHALRVLSVKVMERKSGTTIQYSLRDGQMELVLKNTPGAVSIETFIKGEKIKGAFISPIGRAEVTGANRFYRTPWAIAGDAGIRNWPTDKKKETSHSITGLIPENGHTLVVSTRDYRKFYSHADLYPTGLGNDKKLLDVSIQTEMIFTSDLPAIFITEAPSAFQAMQNEAKEVALVLNARNQTPQTYHWCSWYYAFYYLTEKKLFDYIDGFETLKPRVPIQTVQIDVGYFPHVGDWLETNSNFPNGVEPSVKKILEHNYKAGIWIAPYMVGNHSKLFREHPEWVLRNNDGTMAHMIEFYSEDRLWGAMDEEYYLLDTSNPEVMDYLRNVFRTFRQMGITFFKTDFMFWGNKPSHAVQRHIPGKRSAEYQRELYEMIRQEIGPEAFWLGCISNYAPMIGFVDAMRISWDIGANWSYARNFLQEVHGQQYFNNIWWQNDPDAIILRSEFNHMTTDELESLAFFMGMLGGVVNTSDLFHAIPERNLKIFRMLEPAEEKKTATFPFIENPGKIDVMVRELKDDQGWAVLFFNREETSTTEVFSVHDILGIPEATCFGWDVEKIENMGVQKDIIIRLRPRQSQLFYLSRDGHSPDDINFAGKKISLTQ